MLVAWTMEGPKGFMAEGSFECNMIAEIGEKFVKVIDNLPDMLEDQSIVSWTDISLGIVR